MKGSLIRTTRLLLVKLALTSAWEARLKRLSVAALAALAAAMTFAILTAAVRAFADLPPAAQAAPAATQGRSLCESKACGESSSSPPASEACDLDEVAEAWAVFCEGSPIWEKENVSTPSLDGTALRCALAGGDPYSNIHCYRNLPPEPATAEFTLTLSFYFTPTTSCNNQGSPSVVQALEFSMSKWHQSHRYEFALQWQNVGSLGDAAPQWRYWDPHDQDGPWVALSPAITQCLEGGQWHALTLTGQIDDGQVHYQGFVIDEDGYTLNLTTPPALAPGEPDRLAVAFQLDGNYAQSPYEVIVDQVCLVLRPTSQIYLPMVTR